MKFSLTSGIIGNPPSTPPTGFISPGSFPERVSFILTSLIILASMVATAYIIYGGIQYVMSAGDASKVKTAQNTLQWAVIGLIVTGAAYLIVKVITGMLGIRDLNFTLT